MKPSEGKGQAPAPEKTTSRARPLRLLVVGYGNTLRCDDGVGQKIAEAVEDEGWEEVETVACHQLTPEVAESVAKAAQVVFVDAEAGGPRRSRLRRIGPKESSRIVAHAADPSTILALSRDAFGNAPVAWLLTIPAFDMGYGEELSPRTRRELPRALKWIQGIAYPSGRRPALRSLVSR